MDIDRIFEFCEALFSKAEVNKAQWRDVVSLVFPEIVAAADVNNPNAIAGAAANSRTCAHARTDVLDLSSAKMSYVFPFGHRWFAFKSWLVPQTDADEVTEEDDAEDWFAGATETAANELERSNFYSEMNSVVIDRSATGTGLMLGEMDATQSVLEFTHIPAGTYGVEEDAAGRVNTCVRRFSLTIQQMVEKFGYDNCPEEVQKLFDNVGQRIQESREIWHLVCPRVENILYGYAGVVPERRPFVSVYLDLGSRSILSVGGYYEFPYVCTRFIRVGGQVYGVSPLLTAQDAIRDSMVLDDCIKMISQRNAMPPVAVPADMVDDIDLGPNGINVMPLQYIREQVPREIVSRGDIRYLLEARQADFDEIDAATYVSVLRTISSQDRYMTATEVNSREAEKVLTFTPTFVQLQVDFRAFFNRIFALLMRARKFDTENAPESVIARAPDENGVQREFIINPKVAFVGKMSQAMERVQTNSTRDCLAQHLQLASATQDPSILANYDFGKLAHREALAAGVPKACLRSSRKREQLLKQLQAKQDAAMQSQLIMQQARAQKDAATAENLLQPQA